jgi:hypothetical protein
MVNSQKNIWNYNTFRTVSPCSGRLFCLTVCSRTRRHLHTFAAAAVGHEGPGETLTVRAGISGWKHQRRNHGHSLSKIHGVRSNFIIKFKYHGNYIHLLNTNTQILYIRLHNSIKILWLIDSWCKNLTKVAELQPSRTEQAVALASLSYSLPPSLSASHPLL